jgi:hypothetical protein
MPRNNWEFWLAPMYGLKSKNLTGFATLQRNIVHKRGPFSITEIELRYASFGFKPDTSLRLNAYQHLAPVISIYLKRKKYWIQNLIELEYDYNRLKKEINSAALVPDLQNNLWRVAFIKNIYNKSAPGKILFQLEGGKNKEVPSVFGSPVPTSRYEFMKLTALAEKFIPYKNHSKKMFGLFLKGYTQAFLFQKNNKYTQGVYNPVISGANGANDYGFRQTVFRRSETFGNGSIWNHQLLPNSLGMRMMPNILAKSWLLGITAQSHFIPKTNFQIFADAVLANTNTQNTAFFYTAGISYSQRMGNEIFWEACLPLVYSKNALAGFSSYKFYQFLSFKVSLNFYKPMRMIRTIYQ